MASLRINVLFPPPSAPDVVKRHLLTRVNADPDVAEELAPGVPSKELVVPENATLHLELKDEDDAGNVSPPSVFDGVITDTLPPPTPGPITVDVVEEIP